MAVVSSVHLQICPENWKYIFNDVKKIGKDKSLTTNSNDTRSQTNPIICKPDFIWQDAKHVWVIDIECKTLSIKASKNVDFSVAFTMFNFVFLCVF